MPVLPGVKRLSEMLWLSGVSRLMLRVAPLVSCWLMPWRMIRGEKNYAPCFIELMCQKEPQLRMAQQLSLNFYRLLKTKNKSQLN